MWVGMEELKLEYEVSGLWTLFFCFIDSNTTDSSKKIDSNLNPDSITYLSSITHNPYNTKNISIPIDHFKFPTIILYKTYPIDQSPQPPKSQILQQPPSRVNESVLCGLPLKISSESIAHSPISITPITIT